MRTKRPIVSKNFPDRLKQLRKKKGWSQAQLAKKLGTDDPQPISKYERGINYPTVDMFIKLAQIFEISLDDLIYDDRKIDFDQVKNEELAKRMHKISKMPKDDIQIVLALLDAFIMKHGITELQSNQYKKPK